MSTIVIPGPDLQPKIERVAKAVADKPALEGQILGSERAAEFAFLQKDDVHHGYYKQKLADTRDAVFERRHIPLR